MAEILKLPPNARAEILSLTANRDLVSGSGGNLLLIAKGTGEIEDVKFGLIYRNNPKNNAPDGIGPLGGIAELLDKEAFFRLSVKEKASLVGYKDNVIKDINGNAVLTEDKNIIRVNNIAREVREELADIGVIPPVLDFSKMQLVNMPGIKDDSYIINVWNGQKPQEEVFAITPECYKLYVPENLLDYIADNSKTPKPYGEVKKFGKIPLKEALKHYGKTGGEFQTEEGFDLSYNFRYPHEYLVLWHEASERLNRDPQALQNLIKEIQPDFKRLAAKLGKPLNFIAEVIGIPAF